jgi:hypothetical protein
MEAQRQRIMSQATVAIFRVHLETTQRLTMLMAKWLGQKLQISSSTINTICPDIPVSIHPSRKMTRDLVFQAQAHRLHLVR